MKPGLNDGALKRMASFRPKWAQEESVEEPFGGYDVKPIQDGWDIGEHRDVSEKATELHLYVDNDGDLYRQYTVPIMKNMLKKLKNGTFDRDLAVKGFMYLVDAGAKKYHQEEYANVYDNAPLPWHKLFPKEVRQQVAEWLVDSFLTEANLGNYENLGKSGQVEDEKEDPEFDKSMDYADKLVKKIKKGQADPSTDRSTALADFLSVDPAEVEQGYDSTTFEVGNEEYMVLTEEEASERVAESIKDSLWAFNPSFIVDNLPFQPEDSQELEEALQIVQEKMSEGAGSLIRALIGENLDVFVERAVQADGRGHFLNTYDGNENEFGGFLIYRTN